MRKVRQSRNERLIQRIGVYAPGLKGRDIPRSYERATVIPEGVCQKHYAKVCIGVVHISIPNPDAPHLYIKMCAPCYERYRLLREKRAK